MCARVFISSKQSRASFSELAVAPLTYSRTSGKALHIANPLNAKIISMPACV